MVRIDDEKTESARLMGMEQAQTRPFRREPKPAGFPPWHRPRKKSRSRKKSPARDVWRAVRVRLERSSGDHRRANASEPWKRLSHKRHGSVPEKKPRLHRAKASAEPRRNRIDSHDGSRGRKAQEHQHDQGIDSPRQLQYLSYSLEGVCVVSSEVFKSFEAIHRQLTCPVVPLITIIL